MKTLLLALVLTVAACSPCTMTAHQVCVDISAKHRIELATVEDVTETVIDFWSRFLPRQAVLLAIANSEARFVDDGQLDSPYGPAWGTAQAKFIKVAHAPNELFVLSVYAHELSHVVIMFAWPGGGFMDNDQQHKLMRAVGFY